MKARNVELSLLLLVSLITGAGYWLSSLGATSSMPGNIVPFLGVVLGLLLGAHLFIRFVTPFADNLLFPLVALLNSFGYVMIARIDPNLAGKQSAWTLIGVGAFVLTLVFFKDIRKIEPYRYSLALLGVILLLLPLIPGLGVTINGAKIWLRAGPLSIQPGEFAKVVLAAFLASYLSDKKDLISLEHHRIGPIGLPAFKYFGPMLFAWGVTLMVMVLQRDLGSSLLFFTLFLVMVYVATARSIYVFTGLLFFSAGAYGAWTQLSHVQRRVRVWLDPFEDFYGEGYQIAQASFALADGGISGMGLGLGLAYSPTKLFASSSDMIFAVIGEELGLLGATAVLVTFLLLVSSGIRVALSASSDFESLLSLGLIFLLGFQGFIIMGGILRVLPLTGVTLPFVSYGGSSLVANYIILGIVMRISHNSVVSAANDLLATGAPDQSDWKATKPT